MHLSMWILADWLEDYHPRLSIQDGKRTLRTVRLYAGGLQMEHSVVYIGYAADFIDGAQGNIICMNDHDSMLLEANDLNTVLNRALDAFDYYNNWSNLLREMDKTECALSDVLNASVPVLHRMIAVADASYYVYARAGLDKYSEDDPDIVSLNKENMMTLDSILAINQDQRIRVYNPVSYVLEYSTFANSVAVRNIFFRDRHKGWLITVRQPSAYTRGELDLQDELGDIVEEWLEYHQNQRLLLEKSGIFLQVLEKNVERGEEFYRRIEPLGWGRNDKLEVYVFRNEEDYAALHFSLDHKLEQLGAGIALHFDGNLLFLLNTSLSEMPAFSLAFVNLLKKVGATCGRSPSFTDIFELPVNYEMAVIAADFTADSSNPIRNIESAALPYYFSLIRKNDHAGLLHPALRTLRAYDQKHHTELYQTLEIYIRSDRNYIAASEVLHLHRNSLLYRISRIVSLTGIDLDSYDNRFYLMMSFEIEK